MAETHDRAVYEVETRRVGDRGAIKAVRDEMLSTQQVQRAAQQFDARYASQAADNQRRIITAERERRQSVAEDLQLLALRSRTVNVANAAEVAALRESLGAQREYQQSTKASQAENLRLAQITQQLEQAQRRANNSFGAIPTARIRSGANAVSSIAFAAEQSALGGRQAVIAFGNLATTLSFVSQSAKFASMASGIGAAVVVAGTLLSILSRIGSKQRELEEKGFQSALGFGDVHDSERLLAVLQKQKKELEAVRQPTAAGRLTQGIDNWLEGLIGVGRGQEIEKLGRRIEEVQARIAAGVLQRGRSEQQRVIALTDELHLLRAQTSDELRLTELSFGRSEFDQRRNEIGTEYLRQMDALASKYENLRDSEGHAVVLAGKLLDDYKLIRETVEATKDARMRQINDEQNRVESQAQVQTGLGGDNRERAFEARLQQIELEKQAEIDRGISIATAEEAAQQKIRRAQRERFKEAVSGYAMMSKAALFHGTLVGKIAEFAAEAIRRHGILVQAKKDWQSSKSEYAAALASFAKKDYPGGALHLLAAGGYAASAAYGFAEAGSGGGGGGGSGGGGAGGGTGSTFDPDVRGEAGAGGTTIILQTSDPYNRENIRRTIYEITRSGTLGRPIYLPPTTGIQDQPWS